MYDKTHVGTARIRPHLCGHRSGYCWR